MLQNNETRQISVISIAIHFYMDCMSATGFHFLLFITSLSTANITNITPSSSLILSATLFADAVHCHCQPLHWLFILFRFMISTNLHCFCRPLLCSNAKGELVQTRPFPPAVSPVMLLGCLWPASVFPFPKSCCHGYLLSFAVVLCCGHSSDFDVCELRNV